MHLCEVGVSHFTPPELQSLSSFDGFQRTTNHDNFGLALLIFHVLFGGRHPYSGVPLRSGIGEALETDIKNFRYAYARDNQSRGFSPPPRSIPVSMLPDAVESMFQLAFTERGASDARPTAQQWVAALDGVRGRLKRCGASSMHLHPDHLNSCPWCTLEKQGVVYFVDLGTTFTATSSGFVLARVWALIEQVPPPVAPSVPTPQGYSPKPKPSPSNVPGSGTIAFYRVLVLALAVLVVGVAPAVWFLALVGAFVGWAFAANAGGEQRKAERQLRQAALDWALKEYDQVVALSKQLGPEGFHKRRKQLAELRDEYSSLPQAEGAALDQLHATAHQRQLHQFLDRCFIDRADIKDVGPARKAALRSFGIETAADVERNRVRQVRGFGERLTAAMLDWRKSCERRFAFNPNQAVSDAERSQVRSRFAAKRASLEAQLSSGASELQRFSKESTVKAAGLRNQAEWAAQKLAQAKADLAAL
jgi:DNA-binding helix-hairpin-helix protein with protein kinase domain